MTLRELLTRHDRSEAFLDLVNLYVQGPDAVRREIRHGWDFGVEWEYPGPSRLACSVGEARSCEERLRASLVYDSIEDCASEGLREKLVAFAVIYHSCLRAGIDPVSLFESVASISSDRMADAMREFINRDEGDRSLDAFLLEEKTNADGETEFKLPWD